MKNRAFDEILSEVEGTAWRAFKAISRNFIKNLEEKSTSHLLKKFSMVDLKGF
jgi:hypothetical protein